MGLPSRRTNGSKTPVPDPSKLQIYYVQHTFNGMVVEKLATTPDVKGKKLITQVTHFSEYSPGLDALDAASNPPPPTCCR